MAKKVSDIAQLCHDAYYGDFRPASAFFRMEHFIRFCTLADADIKQQEYRLAVNNNIRMRKPNAPVILNTDYYYTAKGVEVKDNKAVLPYSIMSFPGAGESLNVSSVIPDGSCGNLMRISEAQRWQVCNDKDMVYWVPVCDGIEFINKHLCNFKTVSVTYVPNIEGGTMIQDSRGWAIVSMVSNFMKAMKNGLVIDKSNDGNPNGTLQTEMNKYLIEGLQK